MSSVLEQLGLVTRGLDETVQPFLSWECSPIREWKVRLRMLNIGELIALTERTSNASPVEAAHLSKVHLLAAALVSINDQPIVTDEDVERYNEDHDLTGSNKIGAYEYKVLFVKKLSELIVNWLVRAYDELQDRYELKHLGKPLSEVMRASSKNVPKEQDLSVAMNAGANDYTKPNDGSRETSDN